MASPVGRLLLVMLPLIRDSAADPDSIFNMPLIRREGCA